MDQNGIMLQKSETDMLKDCLDYFESSEVLAKLLSEFVEKYRSFGTVKGTVRLSHLDHWAVEDLEGLLGRNYHDQTSASVSADRVQRAIDASRFAGISLDDLVAEVYSGELKSRRQEQAEYSEQYEQFLNDIQYKQEDTVAGVWLKTAMIENGEAEHALRRKFKEAHSKNALKNEMMVFLNALNNLPCMSENYEYLPIFAARTSGDPHYFDDDQKYTSLLYLAIVQIMKLNPDSYKQLNAEKRHEIMLSAGIMKDPVSNDVMIYGLNGAAHGIHHPGMSGFQCMHEAFSISLESVMKLDAVECCNQKVYAMENPAVFLQLCKDKEISAVCVNGQPNQAVLQLLDRIVQKGAVIFYNGDFDPEGLMIAQRLKDRYGDHLVLWRYSEVDYHNAESSVVISEKRMKMMDRLTNSDLIAMAQLIRKTKKAGYQENLNLIADE